MNNVKKNIYIYH